jgi:hypothetical protein
VYGTPRQEVEASLVNLHTGYEYRADQDAPKTTYVPKQPEPAKPIPPSEPFVPSPLKNPEIKKQETQHRYLQSLIKKMAESRGFTASIEEPTPDGKGKVDVSLKRNTKRIAVEINDTSKDEWELHNIEKCLAAGYDIIVACSADNKVQARMSAKIEGKFDGVKRNNILVLSPEDLFLFLDSEIAKEATSDVRVKGYRVKVNYAAVPEEEMNRKRNLIAKSVIYALKNNN